MIELIKDILIFIFLFFVSFFIHEMMHIKGQGLKATGTIYVSTNSLTCSNDNYLLYPWAVDWSWYSGGILTGGIMFIMTLLSTGWWQWSFLTMGLVQFSYGVYEGYFVHKKGFSFKWRYLIYGSIIGIMIIIWYLK